MISYTYLLSYNIDNLNEPYYTNWLKTVISSEGKKTGNIQYVFCDDSYQENNYLHIILVFNLFFL